MISLTCEWSKQERSWDITIISSSNYDKLIYTNPLTEWQFKTHPNRINCIDHLNVNSACQNNLKKGYFLFHKYLVYIYDNDGWYNIKPLTCNMCSSSSLSSIFMKFWSSGMENTSHWKKVSHSCQNENRGRSILCITPP